MGFSIQSLNNRYVAAAVTTAGALTVVYATGRPAAVYSIFSRALSMLNQAFKGCTGFVSRNAGLLSLGGVAVLGYMVIQQRKQIVNMAKNYHTVSDRLDNVEKQKNEHHMKSESDPNPSSSSSSSASSSSSFGSTSSGSSDSNTVGG